MAGTTVMANSQLAEKTKSAEIILKVEHLSMRFGGLVAINDLSFEVKRGDITAVIGPNGAGKTTVFNLLTKFLQPSSGTIVFDGTDITNARPDKVARMGLVRSFQISAVFPHLTLLENVRVALQRPNKLATQFWRPLSSLNSLNQRAEELLALVGLTNETNTLAADLSYGRKRVLEIATTLALDPKVLLLDEPMAGMGGEDVEHVANLIREVAKTRAVLMVEHNLKVVADIGHNITVLQRGEILAEGNYAEVSADPRVRTAYMGTEED